MTKKIKLYLSKAREVLKQHNERALSEGQTFDDYEKDKEDETATRDTDYRKTP